MTRRASELLPEPDSPTMPTNSPGPDIEADIADRIDAGRPGTEERAFARIVFAGRIDAQDGSLVGDGDGGAE